jgi:hypothetical protein
MYRSLDRTMGALGIARPKTTPPLLHARQLEEASHPEAETIMVLTQMYVDTRFGGLQLTERLQARFNVKLRRLKQSPAAKA